MKISLWLSSLRTPESWNADEVPHMYIVKGSCQLQLKTPGQLCLCRAAIYYYRKKKEAIPVMWLKCNILNMQGLP